MLAQAVAGDAEKPAGEADRAGALAESAEGFEEGFLNEVLDALAAAQPAEQERGDGAVEALGKGVERLGVAAEETFDQFGFAGRLYHGRSALRSAQGFQGTEYGPMLGL